jgi:UDP-N-acetylmuramoyl-tripeptide--D-alanyl-D-alanine ligase
MQAKISAQEILDVTEGRIASGLFVEEIGSLCSDTRIIEKGQWFIALPGNKFDGHDFLAEAYIAGALGAIVNERLNYPIGNKQFLLIAVDDTLEAYAKLSKYKSSE